MSRGVYEGHVWFTKEYEPDTDHVNVHTLFPLIIVQLKELIKPHYGKLK